MSKFLKHLFKINFIELINCDLFKTYNNNQNFFVLFLTYYLVMSWDIKRRVHPTVSL